MLRHVIAIGPEGNPVDPLTREPVQNFDAYVARILGTADSVNDARGETVEDCASAPEDPECQEHRLRKILIHIHGGLNDPSLSLEQAVRNIRLMRDETGPDWTYPVFITWPSGALDTYNEHLFVLRQGRHSPLLGFPSSPIYLATDLFLGMFRSPRSTMYTLANDAGVGARVGLGVSIWPSWKDADRILTLVREKKLYKIALGDYSRGFLEQSRRFFVYWLTFPSKLLTTWIVLDGMGNGAWEVMQHRMRNTLRQSTEFEHSAIRDSDVLLRRSLERDPTGGVARFFLSLQNHIRYETRKARRSQKCVGYEITLVGHSMGASILNEALRLFPDLPITTILYMAPACSIVEAEQTLVPFLAKHENTEFYLTTLHPIAEADEINFWDIIPRGSLLEWIDNWYTTPTNHDRRRLGKWDNIIQALHVFKNVRDRFFLKGFGVDGDSKPQRHGEFNLCPFWKENFRDPKGRMTF